MAPGVAPKIFREITGLGLGDGTLGIRVTAGNRWTERHRGLTVGATDATVPTC